MLKAALLCRLSIPLNLSQFPGNLISIQVVKRNCSICQTGHLHISNIIYLTGIFQNSRNIRSHIAFAVSHSQNHGAVLSCHINLPGIITEHHCQSIGTTDTHHGMIDSIYRSSFIFFVIIINQLNCRFCICGRIKDIALSHQLILQFLIIFNNTIMNAHNISIIRAMRMRIRF